MYLFVYRVEEGVYTYNYKYRNSDGDDLLPDNIGQFKENVIDALIWYSTSVITDYVGGTQKLVTLNTKAISLMVKIINFIIDKGDYGDELESLLSDNELIIFNDLTNLAENGYSDSDILKKTLNMAKNVVRDLNSRINNILRSNNKEEIISIVNELYEDDSILNEKK